MSEPDCPSAAAQAHALVDPAGICTSCTAEDDTPAAVFARALRAKQQRDTGPAPRTQRVNYYIRHQ